MLGAHVFKASAFFFYNAIQGNAGHPLQKHEKMGIRLPFLDMLRSTSEIADLV